MHTCGCGLGHEYEYRYEEPPRLHSAELPSRPQLFSSKRDVRVAVRGEQFDLLREARSTIIRESQLLALSLRHRRGQKHANDHKESKSTVSIPGEGSSGSQTVGREAGGDAAAAAAALSKRRDGQGFTNNQCKLLRCCCDLKAADFGRLEFGHTSEDTRQKCLQLSRQFFVRHSVGERTHCREGC